MSYYQYPKYVPVAQKQAKAEKKIKQLRKKNPDIAPVVITGKTLANTWWGKEWNSNLERYADFSNRVGRGRSYVRHGAVLDLKIEPGRVRALVQGSASRPYEVTVDIDKIPNRDWSDIKQACRGNMDNMQHLIAGRFPKKLADIFTCKGKGLFPTPDEIKFSCSCPDWAYMCKHVAAVLYGIGARLDTDPTLFFTLRRANINELISETIQESKQEILLKSNKKTSRVIEDEDSLSELFGVNLGGTPYGQKIETGVESKEKSAKAGDGSFSDKNKTIKDKTVLKRAKKSPSTSSAADKKEVGRSQIKYSDSEVILKILKRGKKAMTISDIIAKASMPDQKVRNILYRLKGQGAVENSSRGIYRII